MSPSSFSTQKFAESLVVQPQHASAEWGFGGALNSKGEEVMKNIYVGNLSFDATEDQVRSMFEAYGPVERVSIVTDRDTGQPRGFAFVEMTDDDSAGKAMDALNGTNLGGRNLTVNEARPKADRPRGGGGGGGGRGGFGGGGGGRGGGGGGRGRSGGGGGGGGWGR
ncbi:MAG TPA: RNA-binding protein [Terriglobales bacterium]|jgi:RNA recognition motif-containing protein